MGVNIWTDLSCFRDLELADKSSNFVSNSQRKDPILDGIFRIAGSKS